MLLALLCPALLALEGMLSRYRQTVCKQLQLGSDHHLVLMLILSINNNNININSHQVNIPHHDSNLTI